MKKQNNVVPAAGSTAAETALWIFEDGQSQPYKHIIDGECSCKTCESRFRHIIYPIAA